MTNKIHDDVFEPLSRLQIHDLGAIAQVTAGVEDEPIIEGDTFWCIEFAPSLDDVGAMRDLTEGVDSTGEVEGDLFRCKQ
jgi:hypothetical protein